MRQDRELSRVGFFHLLKNIQEIWVDLLPYEQACTHRTGGYFGSDRAIR